MGLPSPVFRHALSPRCPERSPWLGPFPTSLRRSEPQKKLLLPLFLVAIRGTHVGGAGSGGLPWRHSQDSPAEGPLLTQVLLKTFRASLRLLLPERGREAWALPEKAERPSPVQGRWARWRAAGWGPCAADSICTTWPPRCSPAQLGWLLRNSGCPSLTPLPRCRLSLLRRNPLWLQAF